MLVTNSHFKFSEAALKKKETSIMGGLVRAFNYGLNKLIDMGKHQAECPLSSVELAMCVAQCMGKKYLSEVETAGLD